MDTLYRKEYLKDFKFYAYVISSSQGPYHFKLEAMPRYTHGLFVNGIMIPQHLKLDPTKADLVRKILNELGALDIKEYEMKRQHKEGLILYLSFDNQFKAKTFYE